MQRHNTEEKDKLNAQNIMSKVFFRQPLTVEEIDFFYQHIDLFDPEEAKEIQMYIDSLAKVYK